MMTSANNVRICTATRATPITPRAEAVRIIILPGKFALHDLFRRCSSHLVRPTRSAQSAPRCKANQIGHRAKARWNRTGNQFAGRISGYRCPTGMIAPGDFHLNRLSAGSGIAKSIIRCQRNQPRRRPARIIIEQICANGCPAMLVRSTSVIFGSAIDSLTQIHFRPGVTRFTSLTVRAPWSSIALSRPRL